MVLKPQRRKNVLNLKSNNNSNILNNSVNREQDCSNNTRSLHSNNSTPLLIFHQNIKTTAEQNWWAINAVVFWISSHICLTEHHLCNDEVNCIYINSYILGAKYCRVNRKYGGVSIFIHETLPLTTTDLNEFCNDQDIEICGVKSHFSSLNFCVGAWGSVVVKALRY